MQNKQAARHSTCLECKFFSYTRTHIFLARTQVHTRTNSKHIVLISGATSKYNRLGNLIFYQFSVHKSLQSIKALGLL